MTKVKEKKEVSVLDLDNKSYGIDFVWAIKSLPTRTVSPTLKGTSVIDPIPNQFMQHAQSRSIADMVKKQNGDYLLYLPDRVETFKNLEDYSRFKALYDNKGDVVLVTIKKEVSDDLSFGDTGVLKYPQSYREKPHLQ